MAQRGETTGAAQLECTREFKCILATFLEHASVQYFTGDFRELKADLLPDFATCLAPREEKSSLNDQVALSE